MRIIAGFLGGRTFDSPHGHRTHPMGDKIRGALFNVLGDVEGLTVLDAFAGSGALSFEAISRGAERAVALDVDKSAYTTIVNNLKQLRIGERVKAIRANATGWSNNNPNELFDLVLLDPPYDDVQDGAVVKMAAHCKQGGVVVVSLPPDKLVQLPDGEYELLMTKAYADARLHFWRKM